MTDDGFEHYIQPSPGQRRRNIGIWQEAARRIEVREALARIVEENFEAEDEPRRTADAILSRFEVRLRGPVTDAEVEAAVKAWWEYRGSGPGAQGEAMRAALEAARGVRW